MSAMTPYVSGEQPQDKKYIKLNTNENPYPPAPAVFEAVNADAVARLKLYPDILAKNLREKIAKLNGVELENVILSNGSDEALMFAFMAFCDEEKQVTFPDITYSFYDVWANMFGVPFETKPLNEDFTINTEDYINCGKNIFLANPNAPTAIALSVEEIEKIVASNSEQVVIVDEAYVDFSGITCVPLIKKYDNILIIQTFSKSRSMAGARLGFAIGSKALIEDMDRVRNSTNPYNVDYLTMVAGAAAIDNDDYCRENCRKIIETRTYAENRLIEMGFDITESSTNFIFAKTEKMGGFELYKELKNRGVLVRNFAKPRIADYNRITIGTYEETKTMLDTIQNILEGK